MGDTRGGSYRRWIRSLWGGMKRPGMCRVRGAPNGTLPSLVWCWSALLSLRFGVCGDAGDERVELAGQCAVLFA